jgi:hypothetical protein
MSEFLSSCLSKYEELVGKPVKFRHVDTPFIEDLTPWDESQPRGELQSIAARILMKVLHAARMCRFDLLKVCCHLATQITKWGVSCDRAVAAQQECMCASELLTPSSPSPPPASANRVSVTRPPKRKLSPQIMRSGFLGYRVWMYGRSFRARR